jgi:predicted amidohydrolase
MAIDILIRNGHVIDPSCGVDSIRDIGIDDGVVVKVDGRKIDAVQTVDVSGCYVFPGLIDFHTHLFFSAGKLGSHPNYMLSNGVTSMVDAGSAGCDNYKRFHDTVVNTSEAHIKTQISCYPTGMANGHENFSPELFKRMETADVLREYPGEIIGLKIRLSHGLAKGIEVLSAAIRFSEDLGELPLCVHVTDSPCTMEEIVSLLRPGDIFCHMYHGTGHTILDENGRIFEELKRSRERGVIFDAAAGKMNGSHRVATAGLQQGFPPDVIATDMTGDKLHYSSRARDLPFVMSRFLCMGMELPEIVKCVTTTPAKLMREEGRRGTLKPGAVGDLVVMSVEDHEFSCFDTFDAELVGRKFLVPRLTVLRGEIAFCDTTFNLPKQ